MKSVKGEGLQVLGGDCGIQSWRVKGQGTQGKHEGQSASTALQSCRMVFCQPVIPLNAAQVGKNVQEQVRSLPPVPMMDDD